MAGEHFSCDLRVAWLVGAQQAEISETEEKKKAAESGKEKPIGAQTGRKRRMTIVEL